MLISVLLAETQIFIRTFMTHAPKRRKEKALKKNSFIPQIENSDETYFAAQPTPSSKLRTSKQHHSDNNNYIVYVAYCKEKRNRT